MWDWMSAASAALVLAATPVGLAAQDSAADDRARRFEAIDWVAGPVTGEVGSEATLEVPAGCTFTGAEGTSEFMELTENPTSGDERATVLCSDENEENFWFVVFTYLDDGYVPDTERDEIDADKLLKAFRRNNESSNRERERRGWTPLTIDGWATPPHYDARTNNLTWGLQLSDDTGEPTINHSVRLLGRGGHMEVDLVASPEIALTAMPAFDSLISTFSYVPGQRYSEWRTGDKVAEYGLIALMAGGAGAVAAKSGLLAKFGKAIIALVVGALAAAKSFISKLFGKRRSSEA